MYLSVVERSLQASDSRGGGRGPWWVDWGSRLRDPDDVESLKAFAARTPLRGLVVILPAQSLIGCLSGLWLGHIVEDSFFPLLRGLRLTCQSFRDWRDTTASSVGPVSVIAAVLVSTSPGTWRASQLGSITPGTGGGELPLVPVAMLEYHGPI